MLAAIIGLKPRLRAAFLLALSFAVPAAAQVPADAADVAAPLAIPDGAVGGMGDINLYPRRIVIDRRQRIATVGLYNKTINSGDYEIAIVDMVMSPSGGVHRLDNLPPGVPTERLKTASAMLRWSPRRVTLRGSEAQTVRIMARPPADLPDGEYRSHFMVVSVPPDVDQGLSIEDALAGTATGGDSIGVSIRPRFGISIPVIVRIGETTLGVGLESPRLVDLAGGSKGIVVTVTRSGTRSAYGDIIVTAAGRAEPVALARGIGVYPEVDSRQVVLALDEGVDPAQLRPGTQLTMTFVDDDFTPGETLARQEFVVP